MKLFHLLLSCALVLFLFSCKSPSSWTNDTTTIKDIFPLAYGDYWTYNVTYYNINDSMGKSFSLTNEVVDSLTIDGHRGYRIDDGNPADILLYYYNGADLFQKYTTPTSIDDTAKGLFFHYPMYQGETYVLFDTTYSGYRQMEEVYLVEKYESVTVPAGTFFCSHFRYIYLRGDVNSLDTTTVRENYYAVGVGLVKGESYDYYYGSIGIKLGSKRELVSYILR